MNRPPPHLTHCRDGMRGKGLVIASALVLNRFPGRSLPEGPCARLSDSGPYVHVDSAEITAARVACRRDGAPTLPGWMGSCGVNGASWAHIRWSLLPITGRVAGGLPTSTGRRRISEPVADGDKYDRQLSVRKRTDRGTACTMDGELTGGRLGLLQGRSLGEDRPAGQGRADGSPADGAPPSQPSAKCGDVMIQDSPKLRENGHA
jgi:hypothetical protein